jgi:arginyl-tRNA synthetase
VVKGFLNLQIADQYWINTLLHIGMEDNYGQQKENSRSKVMVEYSSPNTNKPLHLGHLRNNFLGNSLSRILKAAGHEVIQVQIINDRGIHICKSMVAWQQFGNGETPESSGLKGDHLVGKYYVEFDKQYKNEQQALIAEGKTEEEAAWQAPIMQEAKETLRKWEAKDEAVMKLWKRMNDWVYDGFAVTYNRMGVAFDKLYYESETFMTGKEKVMEELEKESSDFYREDDSSIWVDLSKEKLDRKLLLRSDGTSVYITQDIGTAILRHEDYNCDQYFYVVGNEQDYHFKVLKLILLKMEYPWANGIEHISYGMVDLPEGKMKSREGTVVDADELMQEMRDTAESISTELGKIGAYDEEEKEELFWKIGLGALKYFILKVDPRKKMLFDPKESVDFNGNTGPFIQYTYARIRSILRKVGQFELVEFEAGLQLDELEKRLVVSLAQYPALVEEAAVQKSPALLANYIYELVKDFNSFYQNSPSIIKETNQGIRQLRLSLCYATAKVIRSSLNLLGISVVERM